MKEKEEEEQEMRDIITHHRSQDDAYPQTFAQHYLQTWHCRRKQFKEYTEAIYFIYCYIV